MQGKAHRLSAELGWADAVLKRPEALDPYLGWMATH